MTTRFLSVATGIVILDVYLRSQLSSNDPLFLLISSNLGVNILMVALATVAVSLSFRKRFNSWLGYAVCSALSVIMIVLGATGILFTGFTYSLWMVFSPLNYLLLLEFGVIFGINSLSIKHAPQPEWARRPRLPSLKLAFLVPKIPRPPQVFNRSSASGVQ